MSSTKPLKLDVAAAGNFAVLIRAHRRASELAQTRKPTLGFRRRADEVTSRNH